MGEGEISMKGFCGNLPGAIRRPAMLAWRSATVKDAISLLWPLGIYRQCPGSSRAKVPQRSRATIRSGSRRKAKFRRGPTRGPIPGQAAG